MSMKDPNVVLRESIFGFLFTWVILEVICFYVLPFLEVVTFKQIEAWFVPSILLGIIGSLVAGFASSGVASSKGKLDAKQQTQGRTVSRAVGLVGFAGVIFPLVYGAIMFTKALSSQDWASKFNDKPVLDKVLGK